MDTTPISEQLSKAMSISCAFLPTLTHLAPIGCGSFFTSKQQLEKIFKLYRLQTKGQKATKETFPSVIAQLWVSLKPEHCKDGFREAGLFPLSTQHVLAKLPPPPALVETEQASGESRHDRQHVRHVTCDCCGHEIPATPLIKTHFTSYFTGVLQIQKEQPEKDKRNNMKIRLEGETVTSDEFLQILEEQPKEKEEKKKGKKKKAAEQSHEGNWFFKVVLTSFSLTTNTISISLSFNTVDDNICQECGAHFDDDDEDDQQA